MNRIEWIWTVMIVATLLNACASIALVGVELVRHREPEAVYCPEVHVSFDGLPMEQTNEN
jgi:hypothetical protein